MTKPHLNRTLSLPHVIFYGIGTILGAGIYSLIGAVYSLANTYTPFSFLIAAFIALFTAISYAELSSRFPRSAGAAYYVLQAFNIKSLAGFVGWAVILSGIISASVLAHGFISYINIFFNISQNFAILLLIIPLSIIALWGIEQSAIAISIITVIEIAGLLLIIFLARSDLSNYKNYSAINLIPYNLTQLSATFSGAFIAFYAFIGFEDMVTIAEEIKNPHKVLPQAILLSIFISSFLYIFVIFAVILSLPHNLLIDYQNNNVLASFLKYKNISTYIIGFIGIVAITNGALAQIIMSSRVLYGLAMQDNAPKFLAKINSKTQTPIISTALIAIIIIIFAMLSNMVNLARYTSFVILSIFILINLALIKIKFSEFNKKLVTKNIANYSIIFPILGATFSALFLITQMIPLQLLQQQELKMVSLTLLA